MIIEKLFIGLGILLAHFLNGSTIFEIAGFKPDFFIIFTIFFALRLGALYGLWIGFIGGLLSDSALGGEIGPDGLVYYKIGLHSLAYSFTGYIVGKFTRSAYNENYFSITIFVFIFTLLSRIIVYIIFRIFFHANHSYSFLGTSIYSAILGPLVFFVLSWIYKLYPDSVEVSN